MYPVDTVDHDVLVFDEALRRYLTDKEARITAYQNWGGRNRFDTLVPAITGANPAVPDSINNPTIRGFDWHPHRFKVKTGSSCQYTFYNPTNYRQHFRIYRHVQRRSFGTSTPNVAAVNPLLQLITPIASDWLKQTCLGATNYVSGNNSNNKALYASAGMSSFAWADRATAAYDYTQKMVQQMLDTEPLFFFQVGAYIQFHGFDPAFTHDYDMALSGPLNFYNRSTQVADIGNVLVPTGATAGQQTLTVSAPIFSSGTDSKSVDQTWNTIGNAPPGPVVNPAMHTIAQTYYPIPYVGNQSQNFNNVDSNDAGGVYSAGNTAVYESNADSKTGVPWNVSSNSQFGQIGASANEIYYSQLNPTWRSRLQAHDLQTFTTGYGRKADAWLSAAQDTFATDAYDITKPHTYMYRFLKYNHKKNLLFRRMYKLRGVLHFVLLPGGKQHVKVKGKVKTLTAFQNNALLWTVSRVLPNKGHDTLFGDQITSQFPRYKQSIGVIYSDNCVIQSPKGQPLWMVSVVGQKVMGRSNTQNMTTLIPKYLVNIKWKAWYKYYIMKPPSMKSTRTTNLSMEDPSTDSTTAQTNYMMPPPPSQIFVSGNTQTTTAAVHPAVLGT